MDVAFSTEGWVGFWFIMVDDLPLHCWCHVRLRSAQASLEQTLQGFAMSSSQKFTQLNQFLQLFSPSRLCPINAILSQLCDWLVSVLLPMVHCVTMTATVERHETTTANISLFELLFLVCNGHVSSQLVMSSLQSILENVDTPELLCQSVRCILQVARCYPHVFSTNFRVSYLCSSCCFEDAAELTLFWFLLRTLWTSWWAGTLTTLRSRP